MTKKRSETTKKPRGRPPEKEPNALGRWIADQGLTREQIADQLSISTAHLARLIHSERRASLLLALKIRDLTKGAIPPDFWESVSPHSGD